MKERHWEILSGRIGFEIKPYEGFTFGKCMEMNLLEHTENIVDIGERSGKEFQIETSMASMREGWLNIEFGLKDFKTTGTSTVTGFDEAMMTLDEHIVLT
jgi:dynein heavy chain